MSSLPLASPPLSLARVLSFPPLLPLFVIFPLYLRPSLLLANYPRLLHGATFSSHADDFITYRFNFLFLRLLILLFSIIPQFLLLLFIFFSPTSTLFSPSHPFPSLLYILTLYLFVPSLSLPPFSIHTFHFSYLFFCSSSNTLSYLPTHCFSSSPLPPLTFPTFLPPLSFPIYLPFPLPLSLFLFL